MTTLPVDLTPSSRMNNPSHAELHNRLAELANLQVADSFNVRDFGPAGSGETNDAGVILLAVAAAVLAGGGRVYFPPGTYLVTSQIMSLFAGPLLFEGAGEHLTTIIASPDGLTGSQT